MSIYTNSEREVSRICHFVMPSKASNAKASSSREVELASALLAETTSFHVMIFMNFSHVIPKYVSLLFMARTDSR